jgi:gas vesicle protein
MTRTKLVLGLTGVALLSAAAGYGCGLFFAPASGKELRRRLAWRAGEWRTVADRSAKFLERAAARAREELQCRKEGFARVRAS